MSFEVPPVVRVLAATIAVLAAIVALACSDLPSADVREAAAIAEEVGPAPLFVDRAESSGLVFHHFNGMTGNFDMAEVSGSGVALFDYDNDGDLDAYLVQGAMLERGAAVEEALVPARHPQPLSDRLYRNELVETGELRFSDITDQAGELSQGYGMAVAVGDYDGDGWRDLYVTNVGANHLLRNQAGRGFEDVTAAAGVEDDSWSVPAAFVDFDRDGDEDLFIGNYLARDPEKMSGCVDYTGAPDYCGPENFHALPDRLFRNRGDGSFDDVSAEAGLKAAFGPALGVVAADLDGDGWLDLYVANDGKPNQYWHNQGDGSFRDESLLAGCALNGAGQEEASMGVDAGDFDGDGDLDLFMTHLISESNTLYRNDGTGGFDDITARSNLSTPSRLHTSFGTGWLDYDLDGWLDLLVVNGAVKKIESLARAGDPFPFHERNQLFRNTGDGRFEEMSDRGGAAFSLSEVSRGAAFGDVDNDGDTDVLLVNNNGPARLLINQVSASSWLGVHLLIGEPPRDARGARAVVGVAADRRLLRRVRVEGSFGSASDPRLLFGLGSMQDFPDLEVHWPDGSAELFRGLEPGRYHLVQRGSGSTVDTVPAGEES